MVNYTCNLICIIVVFIAFASYTWAPWTTRPELFDSEVSMTCQEWLLYYNFTSEDVKENKRLSGLRTKDYDELVYILAAIYAQTLSSFPYLHTFTIDVFCNGHHPSGTELNFTTLNDVRFYCWRWIVFYGYPKENLNRIAELAFIRNSDEDNYIHVWTAVYARYVFNSQGQDFLSPNDFCEGLKNPLDSSPRSSSFMSIHGKTMHCYEWILYYGFTIDNIDTNMSVAYMRNTVFDSYINVWAFNYADYIDKIVIKNSDSKKSKKPKLPKEYCKSVLRRDGVLLNYF